MPFYKNKGQSLAFFVLLGLIAIQACIKVDLDSGYAFEPQLSTYQIFTGQMSDLTPASDYHLYELSTELFSDYAEKQRLIKVPTGTQLRMTGDSLPDFPNGSIIAKTFFYYNDKRDVSKGKKVMETRLLIKYSDVWHAAAYLWNEAQTEATLLQSGYDQEVNWIDANGTGRVINYHVPTQVDCITCHQIDGNMVPVGPRLRNLNFEVFRNNQFINQLQYLQNLGVINTFNTTFVDSLPAAFDNSFSLEKRARAYFEINCSVCHTAKGSAAEIPLYFDYHLSLDDANIVSYKNKILNEMQIGDMPSIATSVIDEDGLDLITQYINSL